MSAHDQAAATGQHAPLYEPADLWTWNTVTEDGDERIEINLHGLKKTVVVSAKDVRQMQTSIDAMRAVRRG